MMMLEHPPNLVQIPPMLLWHGKEKFHIVLISLAVGWGVPNDFVVGV